MIQSFEESLQAIDHRRGFNVISTDMNITPRFISSCENFTTDKYGGTCNQACKSFLRRRKSRVYSTSMLECSSNNIYKSIDINNDLATVRTGNYGSNNNDDYNSNRDRYLDEKNAIDVNNYLLSEIYNQIELMPLSASVSFVESRKVCVTKAYLQCSEPTTPISCPKIK